MPPLELVETSLRHGQQTLLLSRLRREHAVAAAELLDRCGFAALDVFGGTTFEAAIRFLAEDPFDRLRALKQAAPSTPLLANVGGQALVGHRHVADDVVDAFFLAAAAAGVDIFRCFDPLNDIRNLERCVAAAHAAGRSAEAVIIYSDAPSHDQDAVVTMGQSLLSMGYDALCLHDPLGLLGAGRAGALVGALTAVCAAPIRVSFAAQTGQADFAYYAAAAAGAAALDVALAPLSGGLSMPSAEAVVASLRGTPLDPGIPLRGVMAASTALEGILAEYAEITDPFAARVDTSALAGLPPLGAMGHALAELRERGAAGRIGEVEREIVRLREEFGSPPFVTPIAEIIATQAVYNVCEGDRYATISQEVKDYCLGLYGRPPQPIDGDVRRIVNGREEAITCRPADLLPPAIEATRRSLIREGFDSPSAEAVVSYALFGDDWLALARGEAVGEPLGAAMSSAPPAVRTSGADAGVTAGNVADSAGAAAPTDVRELTVEVDGESYQVRVTAPAGSFGTGGGVAAEATARPRVRDGTVVAPMQGLILKLAVKPGDRVAENQVVAVLEAMKMQNDIIAGKAGTVSAVYVEEGAVVAGRDPILQID